MNAQIMCIYQLFRINIPLKFTKAICENVYANKFFHSMKLCFSCRFRRFDAYTLVISCGSIIESSTTYVKKKNTKPFKIKSLLLFSNKFSIAVFFACELEWHFHSRFVANLHVHLPIQNFIATNKQEKIDCKYMKNNNGYA